MSMRSLLDEMKQYQENFRQKVPIEIQKLMDQAIKDLSETNLAKGLTVGEQAPDFTLLDATGTLITLSDELKKGPVILTFYRGAWCPYCNLELRAYQRILTDIKAAGGQLMAVSPQTPDASLTTKEKNELEFIVLSDPNGTVARNFHVSFRLPHYMIEIYKGLGLDIPGHNGNDTWELPVPATFIIDQLGNIRFASVDPDYRKREEP